MKPECFETSCAFLLHEVARLMRKRFDANLADLGFTQSTWRALGMLGRVGELRQSQLGELLAIEKAPMGAMLDRLEREGWITRRPDPTDRRARLVCLREKSLPVVDVMHHRFLELESQCLASFSDVERKRLTEGLYAVRTELIDSHSSQGPEPQTDQVSEFWLLLDCARRMARLFTARLGEIGFTRTQWLILNSTIKQQGIRQIELAATLELSPAMLGKIIDQLETEGWLERRPDQGDRRAKRVYLSSKKARDMAAIRRRFEDLQQQIVSRLSNEGRQQLSHSMQAIRNELLNGASR